MLKSGDIVICVDASPPAGSCQRQTGTLQLGEVYEIIRSESKVFHSVRVARKIVCCADHGDWITLPNPNSNTTWRANRFKKVSSIR